MDEAVRGAEGAKGPDGGRSQFVEERDGNEPREGGGGAGGALRKEAGLWKREVLAVDPGVEGSGAEARQASQGIEAKTRVHSQVLGEWIRGEVRCGRECLWLHTQNRGPTHQNLRRTPPAAGGRTWSRGRGPQDQAKEGNRHSQGPNHPTAEAKRILCPTKPPLWGTEGQAREKRQGEGQQNRGATTRANAGVQHNQAKGGTDQGNGRNLKEEGKEDLRIQVQD